MRIYPAIDLINGQCVRLKQGDYNDVTVFDTDPIRVGKKFMDEGASIIHVVDLDGAKKGFGVNRKVIREMVLNGIKVELGGGIRTLNDIDELLELGVTRVIIGSSAISNKKMLKEALEKYGSSKIVLGVDAKNGYVAINGWLEVTNIRALDLLKEYESFGGEYVIYTDIAKDGMMSGPNLVETKELIDKTNLKIIASGGVSTINDVKNLYNINAYGAIVGKAIYLGSIDLKEAISLTEGK